jgi:hypothetical protein
MPAKSKDRVERSPYSTQARVMVGYATNLAEMRQGDFGVAQRTNRIGPYGSYRRAAAGSKSRNLRACG